MNVTVAVMALVIVNEHVVDVAPQPATPLHPPNVEPCAALALSMIVWPWLNVACCDVHAVPQLMPLGIDAALPSPTVPEIGRASCRERGGNSVGAGSGQREEVRRE